MLHVIAVATIVAFHQLLMLLIVIVAIVQMILIDVRIAELVHRLMVLHVVHLCRRFV